MKSAIILMLLSLIACGHPDIRETTIPALDPHGPPLENKVRDYVWYKVFKETKPPPQVVWHYEQCYSKARKKFITAVDLSKKKGDCTRVYSGLTDHKGFVSFVAWRGTFWHSAYVHELTHAWQNRNGRYDPRHEKYPEDWAQVKQINKFLELNIQNKTYNLEYENYSWE